MNARQRTETATLIILIALAWIVALIGIPPWVDKIGAYLGLGIFTLYLAVIGYVALHLSRY